MEKCKFCQAELTENGTLCPQCGKDNAEQEMTEQVAAEEAVSAEKTAADEQTVEAAPAEEETAQETVPTEESASAEEAASVEETEEETQKATPRKIALAVTAVIVLAAMLIGLIAMGLTGGKAKDKSEEPTAPVATVPADGNPEDVTCKGTYTVTDEEAVAQRDTVVATIGDNQLTNGQLQVYYWSMVNSYLSSEYGYYMMMYGAIDMSQPLDTQFSTEDKSLTWQQFFLAEALDYWQLSQALAVEAETAGIEMSQEDREYLDNLETSLTQTAASYEMTLEELLRHNIGPGGALEDFAYFQELYCRGKEYYTAQMEKMAPDEAELEAFFEEHAADYEESGITKDSKYVDVRHILIQVEGGTTDEAGNTTYSDEEWETCRAEAQAILDAWLEGEATEDSFAALANEKSEDPGSNTNGGLYENVYVGQMVEPFETWCFDETREYGNYGLVQTSYGYHVMYYVGSEPVWVSYAKEDWTTEQTNIWMEGLMDRYPLEVDFEKIVLGYISLGS